MQCNTRMPDLHKWTQMHLLQYWLLCRFGRVLPAVPGTVSGVHLSHQLHGLLNCRKHRNIQPKLRLFAV